MSNQLAISQHHAARHHSLALLLCLVFGTLSGCNISDPEQRRAEQDTGSIAPLDMETGRDATPVEEMSTPGDLGEGDTDLPDSNPGCVRQAHEVCDGEDNDCDGLIDESCPCAYEGRTVGVCASSIINELTGLCEAPPAHVREEGPQHCDMLDNDCDGQIDERCYVRYKDVALGSHHICRLDLDGAVSCSGRKSLERLAAPDGEFSAIVAGETHTCALDIHDVATCWGIASSDMTPPAETFDMLTATDNLTCGLTRERGEVRCWGDFDENAFIIPAEVLATSNNTALDISGANGCVIDDRQHLTCWGRQTIAMTPFDGDGFLSVSVEDAFACGLRNDGTLSCWGTLPSGIEPTYQERVRHFTTTSSTLVIVEDVHGRVEVHGGLDDSLGSTLIPTQDATGEPIEGIARAIFSPRNSCLLAEDGQLICWGSNDHGQLVPLTRRDIEDVKVGARHYCVSFLDDTHDCHGVWHPDGALDSSHLNRQPHPSTSALKGAGYDASCGINDQDRCLCWGRTNTSVTDPAQPTITLFEDNLPLFEARRCQDVKIHTDHLCMLTEEDQIACAGILEDGRDVPSNWTEQVKLFDVGRHDTCVVNASNRARCWGQNAAAKNAALDTLPAHTDVEAIAQSDFTVCLLVQGDELVCLGPNNHGLVSDAPQGEKHIRQLAMGNSHACILREDQTVHCWGSNNVGQTSSPRDVHFLRIDASHANSCGVTVDHELICW